MPNALPGGSQMPLDRAAYGKKPIGGGVANAEPGGGKLPWARGWGGRKPGGGHLQAKPFSPLGTDLFGDQIQQAPRGPLAQRFEFPPFSVLNAREGAWQERKAAWLSLGIKSEVGRGGGLLMTAEQVTEPGLNYYRNREKAQGGVTPTWPLDPRTSSGNG